MNKILSIAAVLLAAGLGWTAVQAQEGGNARVVDASPIFAQLQADRQGTTSQQIMHAPAGDVLAVYIGRAPRQMYNSQDELLYVISGHGTASLGYPSFELKPGSVVSIPRRTAFTITSTGSAPIKALLVASPHNNPDDRRVLEQ